MTHSIGRKVAILLTGSVVAQALPVLAAPLLARLYSPESFGQFGMFTALASVLGALVNLKYDHAVLLAKNTATAFHLFIVCLLISAGAALLLGLFVALAPAQQFVFGHVSLDSALARWLPVSFVLAALTQSVGALLLRGERFASMAKVRVAQALTSVCLSLALGAWLGSGLALILSTILGQCLGVCAMLALCARQRLFGGRLRWRLLLRVGVRYRRFALFTAPSDLLNVLGSNLPLLFIGSLYGLATAGAYTFAQRTLGTPISLLASAFSDAYRQSAAKSLASTGRYWQVAARTMRMLGLLGLVPAVICVALAPTIFPLIFGPRWLQAGQIVQVLGVVYYLRLVVSPLSYNYYLANRHSEDLVLQVLSFGGALALFLGAHRLEVPFMKVLMAYALLSSSVYVFYGVRSMLFARVCGAAPAAQRSAVTS